MASNSFSAGNKTKNKLGQGLSSLHHTTKRLLELERVRLDSVQEFEKKVKRLIDDPSDASYLTQVKASYSIIHYRYNKLIEEEKLIGRMERNQSSRTPNHWFAAYV